MMGSGGKYRGMRPGGTSGSRGMAGRPAVAAFEVSASVYSVSLKRPVGFVSMQYDGPSLEDALQRMSKRLGLVLPSSRCGGWDWKAKVDDARIRALIEQ